MALNKTQILNNKGDGEMSKLIFIGSEATGYYSGSYACEGGFVEKEVYDKYKNEIESIFSDYSFYELDGKHSQVDGDLVLKEFDNYNEVMEFIKGDVEYDTYIIGERLDSTDLEENKIDEIWESVKTVYKTISNIQNNYENVSFYLHKDQADKVREFVSQLRN